MEDPRARLLLDFVDEYIASPRETPLTVDTPLLSERVIDSIGRTLLAAFVEERFGVPFDGTEMRAGRLETIRELLAFIDRG